MSNLTEVVLSDRDLKDAHKRYLFLRIPLPSNHHWLLHGEEDTPGNRFPIVIPNLAPCDVFLAHCEVTAVKCRCYIRPASNTFSFTQSVKQLDAGPISSLDLYYKSASMTGNSIKALCC